MADNTTDNDTNRRKRRSSILKSHRPPRTPFSELEFNVATPTDTSKSRRVSFSRRTGVAEFVTNEATTTWRTFYEEQNKSLESSGRDSLNPPRPSVAHVGNRMFEQQFQDAEAETDFVVTLGVPNRAIVNNSLTVNVTEQFALLERTAETKLTAPQNKFELSFCNDIHQSKISHDDLTSPTINEMSDKININFSDTQKVISNNEKDDLDEIENDLQCSQPNVVCHGPFGDRNNMFQYIEVDLNATQGQLKNTNESDMSITDTILCPKKEVSSSISMEMMKKPIPDINWVEDKENIIVNPYVSPAEADNFAIQVEPEKVLVFDGKKLKYADINADLDDLHKPDDKKPHSSILTNLQTEHKPLKTEKTIIYHGENEISDMSITKNVPQFIQNVKRQTILFDNHDADLSVTQCITSAAMQKKNTLIYSHEEDFADMSVTQAVSSKKVQFIKDFSKYEENNFDDMSFTKAIVISDVDCINSQNIKSNDISQKTNVFHDDASQTEKSNNRCVSKTVCKSIITNENISDMSVTQTLPPMPHITVSDSLKNAETEKESRRQTILFQDVDISMTQVLPTVLTELPKRKTIVSEGDLLNVSTKLQVPTDFDKDNGDLSVTQTVPSVIVSDKLKNLEMEKETRRQTILFHDADISMTQVLPSVLTELPKRKTTDPKDYIQDVSTKLQVPTVFDKNDGDLSITQTVPSVIVSDKLNIPEIEKETRRQTILFHDADISMTQVLPSVLTEAEKSKTIDNESNYNEALSFIQLVSEKSPLITKKITKPFERDSQAEIAINQCVSKAAVKSIITNDNISDMSVTQALPTKFQSTTVFDKDDGHLSITQTVPHIIDSDNSKKPETEKESRRQTILFQDVDISMTQVLPSVLTELPERNIIDSTTDHYIDLTDTQSAPNKQNIKGTTIISERDNSYADVSITQAILHVPTDVLEDKNLKINKSSKQFLKDSIHNVLACQEELTSNVNNEMNKSNQLGNNSSAFNNYCKKTATDSQETTKMSLLQELKNHKNVLHVNMPVINRSLESSEIIVVKHDMVPLNKETESKEEVTNLNVNSNNNQTLELNSKTNSDLVKHSYRDGKIKYESLKSTLQDKADRVKMSGMCLSLETETMGVKGMSSEIKSTSECEDNFDTILRKPKEVEISLFKSLTEQTGDKSSNTDLFKNKNTIFNQILEVSDSSSNVITKNNCHNQLQTEIYCEKDMHQPSSNSIFPTLNNSENTLKDPSNHSIATPAIVVRYNFLDSNKSTIDEEKMSNKSHLINITKVPEDKSNINQLTLEYTKDNEIDFEDDLVQKLHKLRESNTPRNSHFKNIVSPDLEERKKIDKSNDNFRRSFRQSNFNEDADNTKDLLEILSQLTDKTMCSQHMQDNVSFSDNLNYTHAVGSNNATYKVPSQLSFAQNTKNDSFGSIPDVFTDQASLTKSIRKSHDVVKTLNYDNERTDVNIINEDKNKRFECDIHALNESHCLRDRHEIDGIKPLTLKAITDFLPVEIMLTEEKLNENPKSNIMQDNLIPSGQKDIETYLLSDSISEIKDLSLPMPQQPSNEITQNLKILEKTSSHLSIVYPAPTDFLDAQRHVSNISLNKFRLLECGPSPALCQPVISIGLPNLQTHSSKQEVDINIQQASNKLESCDIIQQINSEIFATTNIEKQETETKNVKVYMTPVKRDKGTSQKMSVDDAVILNSKISTTINTETESSEINNLEVDMTSVTADKEISEKISVDDAVKFNTKLSGPNNLETQITERNDMGIDVASVKGDRDISKRSSSLMLVDDAAIISDIAAKDMKEAIRLPSKLLSSEKENLMIDGNSPPKLDMSLDESTDQAKPKKRNYSPMKLDNINRTLDTLNVTPKPLNKVQKLSDSPNIMRMSISSFPSKGLDMEVDADETETQPKHDSSKIQFSIETDKKQSVLQQNTESAQNVSPKCETKEKVDKIRSLSAISKVLIDIDKTETMLQEIPAKIDQLESVQSDTKMNSNVSNNLKSGSECDANVVTQINMLPFMGTKTCSWEICEADMWSFLLLHSRLRLSVRLSQSENSSRTYVHADTPLLSVTLDHVDRAEEATPEACLCKKFATEAMRYLVAPGFSRAGQLTSLVRRIGCITDVALRFGRVMKDASLRLAFQLNGDIISLTVANIPLEAVWEVKIRTAMVSAGPGKVPCPTAKDVWVESVVADCEILPEEVTWAVGQNKMDWGHIPRALWRVFRYLKRKNGSEEMLISFRRPAVKKV